MVVVDDIDDFDVVGLFGDDDRVSSGSGLFLLLLLVVVV